MKTSDEAVRKPILNNFGVQLRAAREKAGVSFAELSRRTRTSEQHLRRMEAGAIEPGLLRIIAICRALNIDITWFLPAVASTEEYVEKLWARHRVGDTLPGADNLDTATKRKILESMGVWRPPADTVQYQCLPVLSDRSALTDMLEQLPNGTTMLKFLCISGAHNLTAKVLDHFKKLLVNNKSTRMEFLLLDPDGHFVHVRAKERHTQPSTLIERIDTYAGDLSDMVMGAAKKDSSVSSRVTLAFYDQHPVWRVVSVDESTLYVSYYPPDEHGSVSPVWTVEKTDAQYTLYASYCKQYDVLRAAAREIKVPYTPPDRDDRTSHRRKKASTRAAGA